MKKTYRGSCHCQAVQFEAALDLADKTFRCNCSFCAKTRMWKAFAFGDGFTLLTGADALSDYRSAASSWPEGNVHHYFCKHCGVRGFSKGYLEQAPFNGWFHAVNVATLDGVTSEELAAVPIHFEDGRKDEYEVPPRITSYL